MKVTTDHPASSYGVPVCLAADGELLPTRFGVQALRARLKLTTTQLAESCGVSHRTVEGWEQGRPVPAAALNVMADLLASTD